MNESVALGVDIGGSHITAALIDLSTGELIRDSYVRQPVDAHGTVQQIITAWSGAISLAFEKSAVTEKVIGIAMPGPFDYEEGISLIKNQNKYDALYGLNVKEMLAEALDISSEYIRFMNDAGCFLRGEVFGGAAKGASHAIGLTLGTGLGSARYHKGEAEDAALWCAPFRDGITEDYLSTKWFLERYESLTGKAVPNVKTIAGMAHNDEMARLVFEEFGNTLAEFLSSFIETDNPEVVVLGGNIVKAAELFFPYMTKALQADGKNVPLKCAVLGEEAALVGAASCWDKNFTF